MDFQINTYTLTNSAKSCRNFQQFLYWIIHPITAFWTSSRLLIPTETHSTEGILCNIYNSKSITSHHMYFVKVKQTERTQKYAVTLCKLLNSITEKTCSSRINLDRTEQWTYMMIISVFKGYTQLQLNAGKTHETTTNANSIVVWNKLFVPVSLMIS